MRRFFAAALLLTAVATSSAAFAQPIVYASPPTDLDVRVIAGENGLRVLYQMRLDEGVWKIEGRDVTGQYVYMRIDAATGQVVRLQRGW